VKSTITRDSLLEGVVRAMYSARLFLKDAIWLYENEVYASAYIIGVIALEQLGRANWMFQKHKEMVAQSLNSLDCATFKKELKNVTHQDTLKQGMVSTSLEMYVELIKYTDELQILDPTSPEFKEAAERYREIFQQKFADDVKAYHGLRMETQYVNPDETGARWTSPLNVSAEEAKTLLSSVGFDNRAIYFLMSHTEGMPSVMERLGIRDEMEDLESTWIPDEWHAYLKRMENGEEKLQ
jgi:AbiV family abortive infection protein